MPRWLGTQRAAQIVTVVTLIGSIPPGGASHRHPTSHVLLLTIPPASPRALKYTPRTLHLLDVIPLCTLCSISFTIAFLLDYPTLRSSYISLSRLDVVSLYTHVIATMFCSPNIDLGHPPAHFLSVSIISVPFHQLRRPCSSTCTKVLLTRTRRRYQRETLLSSPGHPS